jgi:DNA polymerase III subunit epsilon
MLPDKLSFIDVETTGLSPVRDRIIEIGIIRVEDNRIVEKFHSLVNPGVFVSPFISELTGISFSDLESSPGFSRLKLDILSLLKDTVLVAHNVRFDYSFIKNEFARCDINFSSRHFCTAQLFKLLVPGRGKYSLDSLMDHFQISCPSRHRALPDARVLYDFYRKIQSLYSPDLLVHFVSQAMRRPSLPLGLSLPDLDSLPESPGVYIFYSASGAPLYIGKSVNIKQRVLSHFSGDQHSSLEMKISRQVKSMETFSTIGELGALFLESKLIKQMQPFYNRKLRIHRKLVILKRDIANTYHTVKLIQTSVINPSELGEVLGVFKSLKQAKDHLSRLAGDHSLCPKLLGLEKASSACFNYHLGKCSGACVNKVSPRIYNLNFQVAFSSLRIRVWPFPGPVLIQEKNASEQGEAFIVDNWCLTGSIRWKMGDTEESRFDPVEFDLDTYKIIHSFISDSRNQKFIRVL